MLTELNQLVISIRQGRVDDFGCGSFRVFLFFSLSTMALMSRGTMSWLLLYQSVHCCISQCIGVSVSALLYQSVHCCKQSVIETLLYQSVHWCISQYMQVVILKK